MTNNQLRQDNFQVLDENINWSIKRAVVVYVLDWTTNHLVGDHKGCVVALIPYQSKDGRQNALGIAKQIVAANLDYTLCISEE